MPVFYANFHIHTVLSPCADITMTPDIFLEYLDRVNWISITDHNTTKHISIYSDILKNIDVRVIPGIEVTSKEEVHILIYFENINDAEEFGEIIENSLTIKEYDPDKLGYQILCDKNGEFKKIYEKPFLGSSSKFSISEIYKLSKKYNSLFVPAHIFRFNGLITNLGFLPEDLKLDAVEIKNKKELEKSMKIGFNNFLFNSDAHFPEQLIPSCKIEAKDRTFAELKKSILERKVIPIWPH
ncbi:PHP domain-containing protein [Marinitoga aeolica]|uniref:PHP domain-containing protein n=1 Tax=Marinitoga aeolica TaxID=2809031 RepID=A0ABY8PRK3_9BACT|nr:PHP domain-containing protein [Marinitoga aeolica]WGS65247.1 PHP domain-containing protein [Marinitoga aeolica]